MNTTQDNGVKGSQVEGGANPSADPDADFVRIVTDRYMYNADRCKELPLVGWLLNRLSMPPINNRPWTAFLIRTTRPCKVVDREDNIVEVPAGSEVLIPATYTLGAVLEKAAASPDQVYEVRILPNVKVDIGGGQSMWTYDLRAKPKPRPRKEFGLAAVLAPTALLPQHVSGQSGEEGPLPF